MKSTNSYLSIFLVDDDTMYLAALKHKLHEKFKSLIQIATFSDAQECLLHIHEMPDVVVLDYHFDSAPGVSLNGLQVLRKIKAESGQTTVVMLSGQEKKDVVLESFRSGAANYIPKGSSAMAAIQNLLNIKVHERIVSRKARENIRLNYLTVAIFLMIAGAILIFYLKFNKLF
jgi:DNA-binding NarL/FixJ family response regulator